MTAPLVPADVDLRDFPYMPLDVRRLLTSETWIDSADTPRVAHAAMCLWCESWHQVPAASLPDNDKVLARLAMCDVKTWRRIREDVLQGWVKCEDGLLYHPVVAEKALQSWAAKQAQRNRTKAATEAREAKRRADLAAREAGRDDVRHGPRDEQRDVERDVDQGKGREGKGSKSNSIATHTPQTDAGRACRLMRDAGCLSTNPSNPNLLDALEEGVTPETLAQYASIAVANGKTSPFAYAIAAARGDHRQPQPGAHHAAGTPGRKLSAVERVEANIERARRARGELPPVDGILEGQATRLPR